MAHCGLDTAYATFDPSGVILGESNSGVFAATSVSIPVARSLTQISRLPDDRSMLNASRWLIEIEGNISSERSRVTRVRLPVTLPALSSIGRRHTLVLAATLEKTKLPLDATEGSPSWSVPKVSRCGVPLILPVCGEMVACQRLVVSRRAEKNTWSPTQAAGPPAERFSRAKAANAPVWTASLPSAGATD